MWLQNTRSLGGALCIHAATWLSISCGLTSSTDAIGNDADAHSGAGGSAPGTSGTGGSSTGGEATAGGGSSGSAAVPGSGGLGNGGSAGTAATGGASGGLCTPEGECRNAACTGLQCDDEWSCVAPEGGCLRDWVAFCGCDRETFYAGSNCPPRSYAFVGACEDGVQCNPAEVLCKSLPPPCAEGWVPSVREACWGSCVPIDLCVCSSADDCPEAERYTCHLHRSRCGYYLM